VVLGVLGVEDEGERIESAMEETRWKKFVCIAGRQKNQSRKSQLEMMISGGVVGVGCVGC
jgi:hypothetical protein